MILVAASLAEPVATQGVVAAAYLPDYRLNGADRILSSGEIGPRGGIEGLNRVRKGLVAAKWQKGLHPPLVHRWGAGRSRGFAFAAFRSDDRKKFVGQLVDLCEEEGLDGIEFDGGGWR